MAKTIAQIIQQNNVFKDIKTKFGIPKILFFDFVRDIIDKIKELMDRQAADLLGTVDLSGTPAVYPALERGWWKVSTNVAAVDGGNLDGIEVKAGGQLVCDGVNFTYVEDPDLTGLASNVAIAVQVTNGLSQSTSANIINPATIIEDSSIDKVTGAVTENVLYHVTDFTNVEELTLYTASVKDEPSVVNILRRVVFFNSSNSIIGYVDPGTTFNQFTTVADAVKARVMLYHSAHLRTVASFCIKQGSDNAYEAFGANLEIKDEYSQNSNNSIVLNKHLSPVAAIANAAIVSANNAQTTADNAATLADNAGTKADLSKTITDELEVIEVVNVNLVNPFDISPNSTIDKTTGILSENLSYFVTGFFNVNASQLYSGSIFNQTGQLMFRRAVYFDVNNNLIGYYDIASTFNSFTTIAGSVKCRLLVLNAYTEGDVCVKEGSSTMFQPYVLNSRSLRLKEDLNQDDPYSVARIKDIPTPEAYANTETVTLQNSDKILYTGSSSIESYYSPIGKSWMNRAQDFCDWILIPYGWSGNGGYEIADKINTDTPSPSASGVKPSEIKPTYIFAGQTLNVDTELAKELSDDFIIELQSLVFACKAIGAKVIMGTAYTERAKPHLEIAISDLAKKHKAEFIPLAGYGDLIIRGQSYSGSSFRAYQGFYGNAHPGLRTNELYTSRFLGYMDKFKRPEKAILIFNARNTSQLNTELVVRDIEKRAKLFRTIQLGEKHLIDDRYDSLEPVDYTLSTNAGSEWLSLMDGNDIDLADKALIEIIIPKISPTSLVLNLLATGLSSIYLLNVKTNSWDAITLTADKFTFSPENYTDYDKIRILLNGTSIQLSSVSCDVTGGKNKNETQYPTLKPSAGTFIFGEGFPANWETVWDNTAALTSYNQTEKYGVADFTDIPLYLAETNHVVLLDYDAGAKKAISRVVLNSNFKNTLGYQKARIYTTTRIKPLIYDPDKFAAWVGGNNPYTDTSWYNINSYDYATICIGIDYDNGITPQAVIRQRVGLSWAIQEAEIDLPFLGTKDVKIEVWRDVEDKINEAWDMELADVRLEIL